MKNLRQLNDRIDPLFEEITGSRADALARLILRHGQVIASDWPDAVGAMALREVYYFVEAEFEMNQRIPGRQGPGFDVLVDWPLQWSQEAADEARRRAVAVMPSLAMLEGGR